MVATVVYLSVYHAILILSYLIFPYLILSYLFLIFATTVLKFNYYPFMLIALQINR